MNIILSTCGTSVLTNNASEDLRKPLTKYANEKTGDRVPSAERDRIGEHIDNCKKAFAAYSVEEAKRKSAELNGILAFYGDRINEENKKDVHYLLATDTWLGEETANIVALWLKAHGFMDIRVKRHDDLQTADLQCFRNSLADLVKWCDETIKPLRSLQCRVIFNLSGGFKSETGFLQMLGMFYADETIYIFERSSELMRIPRLPVKMDDNESARKDLRDFRRAALGLEVRAEKSGIYWFEVDGAYSLTEWGEFVFAQHKDEIYREQIHPSPSEKIVFAQGFLPSCTGETPSHKHEINEKIDLFARFLENEKRLNLKSLHYHPVKHPRDRNVTHEIYAWSDGGAKRIYCRELDNGVAELLFLGEHL
ncbi:MAG: putative CRISPR-associated protein [Helicobacteraceae bacterium]|nr:putative CRISPR-associated protein [Helicobacteraceae bacterium]